MSTKSPRFGHGYRVHLETGDQTKAVLQVQRDLTSRELARLAMDLYLVSNSLAPTGFLQVNLDVSLSASLARTLEDITQRYELLTTVSVPPHIA